MRVLVGLVLGVTYSLNYQTARDVQLVSTTMMLSPLPRTSYWFLCFSCRFLIMYASVIDGHKQYFLGEKILSR